MSSEGLQHLVYAFESHLKKVPHARARYLNCRGCSLLEVHLAAEMLTSNLSVPAIAGLMPPASDGRLKRATAQRFAQRRQDDLHLGGRPRNSAEFRHGELLHVIEKKTSSWR